MTYNVSPRARQAATSPLTTSIQLPFVAPYLWTHNGRENLKDAEQGNGAPHFGGFAVTTEDFDIALAAWGAKGLPHNFNFYELHGSEGPYQAYMARIIAVVPLARRWRWDETAGRGHGQVLAYMGEKSGDGAIAPLGPVVITAKGHAEMRLRDAFMNWDQKTAPGRHAHASVDGQALPSSLFYALIGTYGPYHAIEVGKTQRSKITPMRLAEPKDYNAEFFRGRYVGDETSEKIADLVEWAQNWIDDWKKPADSQGLERREPANNLDAFDDEVPF
jgi:hypothetical protein